MSALNVKVGDDRVVLWTDGAMTNEKGVMTNVMSKIQPVPNLGGVFATLGDARAGILMAAYMMDKGIQTPHAVVLHLQKAMQLCAKQPKFRPSVSVFAAWFEEHDVPLAYLVSSAGMCGVTPFRVMPVEDLVSPDIGTASVSDADPISVMERQRTVKDAFSGRKPYHGVGGFLQETVIDRHGISMRIIKRWDDKIGHRIEPAAAA